MKIKELFEYFKENIFTDNLGVLNVNHFLLDSDEPLLVQLPYSSDFVSRFYHYIQLRIFISNMGLIPNLSTEKILEYAGSWQEAAMDMPAKNLCNILKESIQFKQERLFLGLRYMANDGRSSWEISQNGTLITIKDWINGYDDGSVFENYLAYNDSISQWQKDIISHFGGYIDGNHVCMDFTVETPEDFLKGIIKYLYMTVLVASGHKFMH